MLLNKLDIDDRVLADARRAFGKPATTATLEDFVLSAVVSVGLSNRAIKKRIKATARQAFRIIEKDISHDYSLRVPALQNKNSLRDWISGEQKRYTPFVEAAVENVLPGLLTPLAYTGKSEEITKQFIFFQIESGVRRLLGEYLAAFVVQTVALRWVSRFLRDGYSVERPLYLKGEWRVNVFRRRDQKKVGVILIDKAGTVLTSPDEMYAAINAQVTV